MNRYTVRISVIEHKLHGPGAVFGQRVPEKLLDATFTTDDVMQIRESVDGLLFEGIPGTQTLEEKLDGGSLSPLVKSGASGLVKGVTLPPTVVESGDLDVISRENPLYGRTGPMKVSDETIAELRRNLAEQNPEDERMKGGKHSGDCRCSGCAEPDPDPGQVIPADAFEPPIGGQGAPA